MDYEYRDPAGREEALGHFEIAYNLVKDRIQKDSVIFDVGCSAGFFLELWHDRGFTRLHGLDPQEGAIEYARKHRPYLDVEVGFFGPPQHDVQCDLLVFFQTVFRVPYQQRLFDAIDRCSRKYVMISWVEDSCNLFVRDLHVGLAERGFICIEKRVFTDDLVPFGTEGADGLMIDYDDKGGLVPKFVSHYLFRRVAPGT